MLICCLLHWRCGSGRQLNPFCSDSVASTAANSAHFFGELGLTLRHIDTHTNIDLNGNESTPLSFPVTGPAQTRGGGSTSVVVGEANAAKLLLLFFSLQVSLSESRLPQTSAVSALESTQVSKIRKLAVKLACLHLLKGGFLTK